ncbi:stage II sporulation protein M [Candidatus Babeliales bacterium]|nr:stage II sporulation protein M [Candidatus Babeliales bacterium]MCF7910781.1 stage II sporulation protein M [Candidatus Pacearchaeota archaeon]
MLESLINPKRAEKGPWKMLLIGIIYGSLSLLLVHWFFSGDPALSQASGMMVVIFCMMFTMPFMYFIIKREEREDEEIEGFMHVWAAHKEAIYALMWLFLGLIIAFSFWHIILKDANLLNFQIETYCYINSPGEVGDCIQRYSSFTGNSIEETGNVIKVNRFLAIVENNVFVMIFTLIFSLIFGAGAIFVLIWNASVIAAAIGIFAKYDLREIPLGVGRYMLHGFPEIAAYFITALAGGIFGAGMIRNGIKSRRFLRIVENSAIMLFLALLILIFAGVLEVYITPMFF